MPIYEFECLACKKPFEVLVRTMSDDSPRKCPDCGSSRSRRMLSVFKAGAAPAAKSISEAGGSCSRCGGVGPCGGEMD
jgi:putative FmdB family regulatory protein